MKLTTSEVNKFAKFEKIPKNIGYKGQNKKIIHDFRAI